MPLFYVTLPRDVSASSTWQGGVSFRAFYFTVIPSVAEESRGNEPFGLFFLSCPLQSCGVDSPIRGNGACAKRVAAAAERGWRA